MVRYVLPSIMLWDICNNDFPHVDLQYCSSAPPEKQQNKTHSLMVFASSVIIFVIQSLMKLVGFHYYGIVVSNNYHFLRKVSMPMQSRESWKMILMSLLSICAWWYIYGAIILRNYHGGVNFFYNRWTRIGGGGGVMGFMVGPCVLIVGGPCVFMVGVMHLMAGLVFDGRMMWFIVGSCVLMVG